MCIYIRLKCSLLAACNRHRGLNAGRHCEEEEGGLQTKSQDEKKKRKAGVIQRKQALQSRDEFASHCLFSTQLVPASGNAILGVGQQEALRGGVKSPGFSPCFRKIQQRLLLVRLGPASCCWSSWMIRTWRKSLRKCIGGKQIRLEKIELVLMVWLACFLPPSDAFIRLSPWDCLSCAEPAGHESWAENYYFTVGEDFVIPEFGITPDFEWKPKFPWLQNPSQEPHGALPSHALEPAALCQPIGKAFPELAAWEVAGNSKRGSLETRSEAFLRCALPRSPPGPPSRKVSRKAGSGLVLGRMPAKLNVYPQNALTSAISNQTRTC